MFKFGMSKLVLYEVIKCVHYFLVNATKGLHVHFKDHYNENRDIGEWPSNGICTKLCSQCNWETSYRL